MEPLFIKGSLHTPFVDFNSNTGILELRGRSIPEETLNFYNPLIQWVEQYIENPQPNTLINLKIEYLNSGSHTSLLVILKKLEELHIAKKSGEMLVKWYYEQDDEYMMEAGEEFRGMLKMPFEFISVVEFEEEKY